MLTKPPVNEGTPNGTAVPPSRSVQCNRVLLHELLTALGNVVDVAALGSGYSTPALMHWSGALLVRWAEAERAAMAERLAGDAN